MSNDLHLYCPKCNIEMDDNAKFCPQCGSKLESNTPLRCPKCHKTYPKGTKFCSECGTPLDTPKNKCSHCGQELTEGQKFCPTCGKPTGATAATAENAAESPKEWKPETTLDYSGDTLKVGVYIEGEVCVPGNVKTVLIGDAPNLTGLYLPDSVEKLEFGNSPKLEKLRLPQNISVRYEVGKDQVSPKLLTKGDGDLYLANNQNPYFLLLRHEPSKSLTLNPEVCVLGAEALAGYGINAPLLEPVNLDIPENVRFIGSRCFSGSSITKLRTGPNAQLESFVPDTFTDCKNLVEVWLPEQAVANATAINPNWAEESGVTCRTYATQGAWFNLDIDFEWIEVKPKSLELLKKMVADAMAKMGDSADLNFINTSHITDMTNLFHGSKFNGDISRWDVSKVTKMSYMFYKSIFNGDISQWDVSHVEDMSSMFSNSQFNGDISRWDVSNVTIMSCMFQDSKFNRDIKNWDTSSVKNANLMFYCAQFNQDVSKWQITFDADPRNNMFEQSKTLRQYRPSRVAKAKKKEL